MSAEITMPLAHLGVVLTEFLDPCSSLLPGQEPIPDTVPPDPIACEHWRSMLAFVRATDIAIDRMLGQQRLGDALGSDGSTTALETNRAETHTLIDDICGTPPRWPLVWPKPRHPLPGDSLTGPSLMMVGARFLAAAEHLDGNSLQPEFRAAADQLFAVGQQRVASRSTEFRSAAAAPRPSVCEMLEKAIHVIAQNIEQKEGQIDTLRRLIIKLQGLPDADVSLIAELEDQIRDVQAALEFDRAQFTSFQEEHSASCGPS